MNPRSFDKIVYILLNDKSKHSWNILNLISMFIFLSSKGTLFDLPDRSYNPTLNWNRHLQDQDYDVRLRVVLQYEYMYAEKYRSTSLRYV